MNINDFSTNLYRGCIQKAELLVKEFRKNGERQLTEDEKFSICVSAGVEIEFIPESHEYPDKYICEMRTKNNCGVSWCGDNFMVCEQKRLLNGE